jgi:Subtilase family
LGAIDACRSPTGTGMGSSRGHRSVKALATAVMAGALTGPAVALPRVGSGNDGISVTFWDHPTRATAAARLSGLGELIPLVPEAGVWTLVPAEADARDLAAARPRVRSAEWPLERRIHEITDPPAEVLPPTTLLEPGADPTDPFFLPARQWGLFAPATTWSTKLIGLDPRPPIAILDGGIDATHEEWSGQDSPIISPRNTFSGQDDNARDNGRTGHGTHVAGIAAAPVNGVGIVGVAPAHVGTAPIIPVKIADIDGRSTDETMIKGIKWAVNHGAKVINISAGGPGYSQAFQNVVNWAFPKALIVASVGNEGLEGNDLNYPAAYDHVLGVGAQCDNEVVKPECPEAYGPVRFTNHNRSLDVIAPGVDVLSSVPRRVADRRESEGYAYKDGTSMAAPFVSGVAALVFAQNRDANGEYPTPDQVLRQIEVTATDVATPGRDGLSGHGIVDPQAAITTTLPPRDVSESNDDVRQVNGSANLNDTSLPATIPKASIDFYDDPNEVYSVLLRKGQPIDLRVTAPGVVVALRLWKPVTRSVVRGRRGYDVKTRVAASNETRLGTKTIRAKAPARGRYYVQVTAISGSGDYELSIRPGGSPTP